MPRCCGSATCACSVQAGQHILITGSGTAADPFVIVGDVVVQAQDNTVFDVAVTGLGTAASPWQVSVNYANSAKLNDLPDVNAPSPANGQVLMYNTSTGQWENKPSTTAPTGAVSHDTSLLGDGSAGNVLQVNEDPATFLATRAAGLGLSDAGINQTVRKFADSTARSAASPAPTLNTLSVLGSAPGEIDYWTGSAWQAAGGAFLLSAISGQELYQMSGPYAGGRLTVMVRHTDTITDADGLFDAITAADLAGRAGIMNANCQPVADTDGLINVPSPFMVMLSGESGALRGRAYRIDDGQPYASAPIVCSVTAFVY